MGLLVEFNPLQLGDVGPPPLESPRGPLPRAHLHREFMS